MEKIIILFYNTMFNTPLQFQPKDIPKGFSISTDRNLLSIADAVVFHLPDLHKFMDREEIIKPEKQIWISWTLESEENYLWTQDDEIKELFDLRMGYHMDDDILYTYYNSLSPKDFIKAPTKVKKNKACMFISSPYNKSKRLEFIKELMNYTEIDSYGAILHNCDLFEDNGTETLKKTMSEYKFFIAFENAISKDYVTEKFFYPLQSGTVPVYLGAPNISEFTPGVNCYINAASFESPQLLGTFMNQCYEDDKLYESFFRWKSKKLLPQFVDKLNAVNTSPFWRLCHKVREYKLKTYLL